MRSISIRIVAGVAAIVAVIGIVVVALVSYADLDRRPWLPLGIVLVAAGAVGLLIATTMQAMRTEDKEAHRTRGTGRRRSR
jgi:hypothetical protein